MPTTPTTYEGLVNFIIGLINLIIPALFTLMFLYFVWKMIQSWVINAAEKGSREEGAQYAITAVVVFVLGVSVWGIVAMLQQTFFG